MDPKKVPSHVIDNSAPPSKEDSMHKNREQIVNVIESLKHRVVSITRSVKEEDPMRIIPIQMIKTLYWVLGENNQFPEHYERFDDYGIDTEENFKDFHEYSLLQQELGRPFPTEKDI